MDWLARGALCLKADSRQDKLHPRVTPAGRGELRIPHPSTAPDNRAAMNCPAAIGRTETGRTRTLRPAADPGRWSR